MFFTFSNPGHSSIIVESSRVLAQVAKYMKSIPTNLITPLFLESLFYVSSHTDHFIDTVRNYSKIFFEELVRLAAHHHENGRLFNTHVNLFLNF